MNHMIFLFYLLLGVLLLSTTSQRSKDHVVRGKLGGENAVLFAHLKNGLFKIPNFIDYEENKHLFPPVYILPTREDYYQEAETYAEEIKEGKKPNYVVKEHSHDILLYNWLVNHYENTIQMKVSPDKKSYEYHRLRPNFNGTSSTGGSTDSVDLFFLPTGLGDYFQELPLSYWKDLDQEIEKVIQRNYTPEIVQKSKTQLLLKQKKNAKEANPVPSTTMDKKPKKPKKAPSRRRLRGTSEQRQLFQLIDEEATTKTSAITAAISRNNSLSSSSPVNKSDIYHPDFHFRLENTFIAMTYLDSTKHLRYLYHFTRNIRDIHYLRVDNELTPNGRDIFVPYIVPRHSFSSKTLINTTLHPDPIHRSNTYKNYLHPTINHYKLFEKRKYSYMIACREPPGAGENTRKYRTAVYNSLKDCPGALVSKSLTDEEFEFGLLNSDFCFILPGDTSSTSKLYKSIYANCIPVIFVSFPNQLPFMRFLHWNKFSIVVYKDVLKDSKKLLSLMEYLQWIRSYPERLHAYKKHLFFIQEIFDYEKIDYPNVYYLILLELRELLMKDRELLSFV